MAAFENMDLEKAYSYFDEKASFSNLEMPVGESMNLEELKAAHQNFYKNFEIWAGQTKLRGNRERVISSQNLQFVDRSLLNSKYTLDRDIGVWLMNHNNVGRGVLREVISVSKGEGLSLWQDNPMPIDRGLDYTGRLEYLPFGNFANKGDYKGSDLDRETTPKLALGLTFDFNENAVKSRGCKIQLF